MKNGSSYFEEKVLSRRKFDFLLYIHTRQMDRPHKMDGDDGHDLIPIQIPFQTNLISHNPE